MTTISSKPPARFDSRVGSSFTRVVRFHFVIFLLGFLIVCSRRPDAVLNAQFFAEDGAVWYPDAYRLGMHCLLVSQAGYLHTLTRLIALLALQFPFSRAPLIMNLCAIVVQVLPVNVFLSSRFSGVAFPLRLLAGFCYLALPNTYEIDANISTIQWHLALLACLLVLARPARSWGWRLFDAIVLVLISLDGPLGIVLLPVSVVLWWKRRHIGPALSAGLLVPGAVIQALTVLLNRHARQLAHVNSLGQTILNGGATGASVTRFVNIVGRQIFLSSLLGLNTQKWLLHVHALNLAGIIAAAIGLAVLIYGFAYAPIELKLFSAFASVVFAMALAHPLAGPSDHPQWALLSLPGIGDRYYFLPMLAFLTVLFWIATAMDAPGKLRRFAWALLLLLPIGIYRDWRYPSFSDLHFQDYATRFAQAPSGTTVIIPINPDWSMELTKR